MKIVSLSENKKIEKRIAVTPDIAKKYIDLGFEVLLSENYGSHLGITDNFFKEVGAKVIKDEKDLFNDADLFIQLGLPSDEKLSFFKEGQSVIGVLNPYQNGDKLNELKKKELIYFL